MRNLIICLALLWPVLASAELTIEEGYVRGLPPGQAVTAAFMTLNNSDDQPVSIIGATSDAAELAEIHGHRHRNGMMRMEKVDVITVPAKGRFVLEPGDHHLMLINLRRPLRDGDRVTIELQLKDGGTVMNRLPVRSVLNEHQGHH